MTRRPHLHFMGIGGIIMSGLAHWYHADGYRVSGCDTVLNAETERLQQQGITVFQGHSPDHVADADVIISTVAVAAAHPELEAARRLERRVLKRIELLAELFEHHRGVAITGTHGKSTTTGMTATLFLAAKRDPSVLIGAQLPGIGGNVHYGHGDELIAEVDESDPGFAGVASALAVVTNLGDDHIAGDYHERRTYHASFADLEATMSAFASRAERLLYCADWPGLGQLLSGRPGGYSYGFAGAADYRAVVTGLSANGSTFEFVTPSGERYPVRLAVPGRHNVQNATAALAAAHLMGLDVSETAPSLASFGGVGRRWQRRGSVGGALFIDDYAVHPTEVRVVLQLAKDTGRRVRAVLQPHRWIRTARHWPALADAASLADEILVLDIYAAGEETIPGVSSQLIVERLRAGGKRALHLDMAAAERYLAGSLAAGDLVVTLGAGDVWKVAEGVVEACGGDDGSA